MSTGNLHAAEQNIGAKDGLPEPVYGGLPARIEKIVQHNNAGRWRIDIYLNRVVGVSDDRDMGLAPPAALRWACGPAHNFRFAKARRLDKALAQCLAIWPA